jgi:hypothetical protein
MAASARHISMEAGGLVRLEERLEQPGLRLGVEDGDPDALARSTVGVGARSALDQALEAERRISVEAERRISSAHLGGGRAAHLVSASRWRKSGACRQLIPVRAAQGQIEALSRRPVAMSGEYGVSAAAILSAGGDPGGAGVRPR